jgi:hypothetical protein
MREAIGQTLAFGVGVALSPFPIVAVVLMLVTERARLNGPVLGWLAGLALVGTVVLVIASPADASENGQPATWVGVLKLILGGLTATASMT